MVKIKEAAFRDAQGHTVGTGPFHDISAIPETFEVQDEGFLDTEGHFLTRTEASVAVGQTEHQLQSEELDLCKSLKTYHFDDPVNDGGGHYRMTASDEAGKQVGSLNFTSSAHSDPESPFHGYHVISQVNVDPQHRGNGIYGRLIQLASTFVKKTLRSKGLVSATEEPLDKAQRTPKQWYNRSFPADAAPHPEIIDALKHVQPKVQEAAADAGLPAPVIHFTSKPLGDHLGKYLKGTAHAANPVFVVNSHEHHAAATAHGVDHHTALQSTLLHELGHAICEKHGKYPPNEEALVEQFAHSSWQDGHHGQALANLYGAIGIDPKLSKTESHSEVIYLEHEFKIEFRRWLEKRAKKNPDEPAQEPFDLDKAEKGLAEFAAKQSNLEGGPSDLVHDVARQMAGYDAEYSPEFAAARFLAGGVPAPKESIRTALILYDDDFELAALRAYGLPRNEQYRDMLRATLAMIKRIAPDVLNKSDVEPAAIPRIIVAGNPDGEETAASVRRAQAAGSIHTVNLDPKAKHSKGTAIAIDPQDNQHWLLKPGSGKLSPSAGVQDELASQSQREVAFYKIAQALGMGDHYPQTDLVLMDKNQVAAMKLLGEDYKGLDKVRQTEGLDPIKLFEPYLQDGSLFKWAALDWIMGNPDRHANNLMINKDHTDLKLIDHGSAFAGSSFDPAHDPKSFTPYYLRAWTSRNWADMDGEERLALMPRQNGNLSDEFAKWLDDVNEAEITQIMHQYGINPQPTIERLQALKNAENPSEQLLENWAGLST